MAEERAFTYADKQTYVYEKHWLLALLVASLVCKCFSDVVSSVAMKWRVARAFGGVKCQRR